MSRRLIFLLGGARSGKSTYAEGYGRERGGRVLFVATAARSDDEMAERIDRHRAARPSDWETLEALREVGAAIMALPAVYDTVIVDCLTLLAANALVALPDAPTGDQSDAAILAEIDGLLAAYAASTATWLIVSNEVGMGIVPAYPLGRLYRDSLGRANQRVASVADEVLLLVAGLPWRLKG
jgi:adenosylcobinamide kinase/adenosylcobinamide-phosphate guanylyltransferase